MLDRLKTIAKDLLAITWIRRTHETVNRGFLESFGSSRILSHLFFTGNALTFNREQSAVLRGRRNYYRNKSTARTTHVELRRNIHRLEKGLIMRPRREIFARDYITETIEFYETAARQWRQAPGTMDSSEMEWAHDVLTEYFRVSGTTDKTVEAARTPRSSSVTSPTTSWTCSPASAAACAGSSSAPSSGSSSTRR